MRSTFPLYNSHLDLAHSWWKKNLHPGDSALDATCGNGHDTLFIAKCILTPEHGKLWGFDIQQVALDNTRHNLEQNLSKECMDRVRLILGSHADLPMEMKQERLKLAVYNLGYLPGGNKSVTTMTDTTLRSLEAVSSIIAPEGVISVTCYPGHAEGALEQNAVIEWASVLDRREWNVCFHRWVNAPTSPSLLLMQRSAL